MEKAFKIIKKSYIWFIISIFYIPIFFMTILSFNKGTSKGGVSWTAWNGFSWNSWEELGTKRIGYAFLNSLIIGIIVGIIVITIGLLTVYGMWRQKRIVKNVISNTSNIPLINPDIVTAVSLSITLSAMFGGLKIVEEGMIRVIISHCVMILPYVILLLLPRSEKFDHHLLEASQDLRRNKIQSWFSIYVPYMMPMIITSFVIAVTLSFDDFIVTRIVSNTSTIGTLLYQGEFQGWALALGAIMLVITMSGITGYLVFNQRKMKRSKIRRSKKTTTLKIKRRGRPNVF